MAPDCIIPLSDLLNNSIPRLQFHLPRNLSHLTHIHSFSSRYISDHRFNELSMLLRDLETVFSSGCHIFESTQLLQQDQQCQVFTLVELPDEVEGERGFMDVQEVKAGGE